MGVEKEMEAHKTHPRVGETFMLNCGVLATIIEYYNAGNVTIRTSDGIIREHVSYSHLKKGKVNPVLKEANRRAELKKKEKNNHIGKTRMMNCGQRATIVTWRKSSDIDILYDDGTLREHVYYNHFKKGAVSPIYKRPNDQSRIGETRIMNNGMKATIIAYRNSSDIDIIFENGVIRYGVRYDRFMSGNIAETKVVKCDKSRIGEERMQSCGLKAKIINYVKYLDITIRFEDGVIVEHVRYDHFKEGNIAHPNIQFNHSISLQEFAIYYYFRNLGFKKIQKGEWKDRGFGGYEIDLYNEEKMFAVEFDGGFHDKPKPAKRDIEKNAKCKEIGIKLYRLRNYDLKSFNDENSINFVLKKSNLICPGLVDCKSELETILLENGIEFDKNMIDFKRDKDLIIKEYGDTYLNYYKKKYEGMVTYSKAAKQKMKITEYLSAINITIEFEDGAKRSGVSLQQFKRGSVAHPKDTKEGKAKARLGEIRTMKNGMDGEIIEYFSYNNITVRFPDGTIVKNKTYGAFCKGEIGYPNKKC